MSDPIAPPDWKAPDEAALCYLDFLGDDLFLPGSEHVDSGTLAAACALDNHSQDEQHSRKRSREQEAAELFKEEAGEDVDTVCSTDDKSADKKHNKGLPAVSAKNKACREKQRRERINVSFLELAKLLDPGKEPKTDKSSILCDGIRVVQQLRVENNQLRQLNKFLEERVAQMERERGQQLFQFASFQQPPQATAPPAVLPPPNSMMAGHCVTGVPCAPSPPPGISNMAAGNMVAGVAVTLQQQQQQVVVGGVPSGQQQQVVGGVPTGQQQLQQVPPSFTMMGKPMMLGQQQQQQQQQPAPYWLPAGMLDTTQDSLLRPPAA